VIQRLAGAAADARPAAVRNFLAYSLQRLGVNHTDIYRLARLDPAVPIEETVGAIADAVLAGWHHRVRGCCREA
jgi:aryl-alcohol dehydrogenase-like predicted oxidoreductase